MYLAQTVLVSQCPSIVLILCRIGWSPDNIIDRPGVAGAVLQTASSLID